MPTAKITLNIKGNLIDLTISEAVEVIRQISTCLKIYHDDK